MSNLIEPKSRIITLRNMLQLSQQDFADHIGITQGALSQLESGKSHLSLSTLTKISSTFNVNCNWLINGKNDVFLNIIGEEVPPKSAQIIIRDVGENALIPLVREEAHAGYIQNCQETEYITALDVYKIPGYESGNFRLFEIEGSSMIPTLFPREIVVSEHVPDWSQLHNGAIYILVTKEGILAKRVYSHEGEPQNLLTLKSDNTKYHAFDLAFADVLEIWQVQAKITSVLMQNNFTHTEKIQALEADVKMLKEQLMKINQPEL